MSPRRIFGPTYEKNVLLKGNFDICPPEIAFIRLGTMKYGFLKKLKKYVDIPEQKVVKMVKEYVNQENIEEYRGFRIDIYFIRQLNLVRIPWPTQRHVSDTLLRRFIAKRRKLINGLFALSVSETRSIEVSEEYMDKQREEKDLSMKRMEDIVKHQDIRKIVASFKSFTKSYPDLLIHDEVQVMQSFGFYTGRIQGYTLNGKYIVVSTTDGTSAEANREQLQLFKRNSSFSSYEELNNHMYEEEKLVNFFPGDFVQVEIDPENDSVVECALVINNNIELHDGVGVKVIFPFNNTSTRNNTFYLHQVRKVLKTEKDFEVDKKRRGIQSIEDKSVTEEYDELLGLVITEDEIHAYNTFFDGSRIFHKKYYKQGEAVCARWKDNNMNIFWPGRIVRRIMDQSDVKKDEYEIQYEDGDIEISVPPDRIAAYNEELAQQAREYIPPPEGEEEEEIELPYRDDDTLLLEAIGSVIGKNGRALHQSFDGESNKRKLRCAKFEVDDRVQKPKQPHMGGSVKEVQDVGKTSYTVIWDNDVTEENVHEDDLHYLLRPKGMFEVNTDVDGLFEGHHWYPGKIVKINKKGRYTIEYEDGDRRVDVGAKYIRYRNQGSCS